jgi:hypothetical protein
MLASLAIGCTSAGPNDRGSINFDSEPDTSYPVAVVLLADTVRVGTFAPVLLRNGGDVELLYNVCLDAVLEEREANGWLPTPTDGTPACPAIAVGLLPGDSASRGKFVPPDLPNGTYRLRVRFRPPRGRQPDPIIASSKSFVVIR